MVNVKKYMLNPKIIIPIFVLFFLNLAIFIVSYIHTNKTLEISYSQAFKSLETINNIKHHKLKLFFSYRKTDIIALSHNSDVIKLSQKIQKLDSLFEKSKNKDYQKLLHLSTYEKSYINVFLQQYIYNDLLLIDPKHNHIMLSAKNKDLIGKKIGSSSLKVPLIKKLIEDVIRTKQTLFSDMELSPINKKTPSMMLATPVIKDNKIISVLMLQLPSHSIDEVVRFRGGMGKTGESYIVGHDNLLRSNSYLKKEFNIKNSFTYPNKYKIDTKATQEALEGKSSFGIIKDYRGIDVFSTYRPFNIDNLKWVIVSEINESEILDSYSSIKYEIILWSVITSLIITFIAHIIIKKILSTTVIDPLKKSYKNAKSFKDIIDNSLNEIYIFDKENMYFTYVNNTAINNCGYTNEEFLNMTPTDIKPDIDKEYFHQIIEPLLKKESEQIVFETRHMRKDGSTYDVEIRLQLMSVDNKDRFVAFIHDITQRNEAIKEKNKYYQKATHDHLTKIYNRQIFDEIYMREFNSYTRYKKPLSLIIFDIDDFKKINDTYGHSIGDKVLIELTNLVANNVRESDIFARWGGEEFVILMKDTDLEQAYKKAEEIRKKIANHHIDAIGNITCSFGVAMVDDATNSQSVFKYADNALYLAKSNGKNIVKKAVKEELIN